MGALVVVVMTIVVMMVPLSWVELTLQKICYLEQ